MLIIRNIFFSLVLFSFITADNNPIFKDYRALLSLFSSMKTEIYNDLDALQYIEKNNLQDDFFEALDIFNTKLSIFLNNPNFILQVTEDDIRLLKNDSKYFTQLKKEINKNYKTKIINTFEFEESNKVWSEATSTPFDHFINNFVISIQYTNSINFGIGKNLNIYRNGFDLDLVIYHPDKITLFNKNMLLSFGLSTSYMPVVSNKNIRISSLDISLTHYLHKLPISISPLGSILKHSDFGLSGSLGISALYYIPFDYFNLLVGLEYNKIVDIEKGFQFDSSAQDLCGIKITIVKDIIFNQKSREEDH